MNLLDKLDGIQLYNSNSIEDCLAFKTKSQSSTVMDWLERTLTMFKWNNLPDSMPERELELIHQINGYGIATEYSGEIVALWGSWAPPYDLYYRAKNVLVNNPWAEPAIDKKFEIGKDCVLFRNDPLNRGMLPLFEKYAAMMTEAEVTFIRALINFRAMFVFTGDSDADKESAETFMKQIEAGKAGSMVSGGFESEVGANPLLGSASNYITQSIEAQQYILGMLYQKIGIQSTFNMKRERLTDDETQLDTDPLRPLIDAMLEERQNFCKAVNEKYGLNISVEFNSSWSKYNEDELVGDQDEKITEDTEDGQINIEPQTETVAEETDQIGNEETAETDTEEPETDTEDVVDKVEEAIETVIEKAADQIVEGAFDDDEEKEDNDDEDESGNAESDD